MDQVKVRFLEERVVDDVHVGTPRETRFRAGEVYDLDARSADRWVRRGVARFISDEDTARAAGASRDAALDMLDPKRQDAQGAGGGNPGAAQASEGSPTGADAELVALSERIAGKLVASRNDISPEAWSSMSAEEHVELLRAADAEIDASFPGLGAGTTLHAADLAGTDRLDLAPGTPGSVDRILPDTDGDRLGDAAGATGPIDDTPVGADFDAMTDEQLREFIDKRDGKRPRTTASRETLLARAKGGNED